VTCEVVTTRGGARAVLDRDTGEVMHPIRGPLVEPEEGYVGPSRLRERLLAGPITVFDVGLGAGGVAIAAWRAARGAPHPLTIVSFDRDRSALRLALAHADDFGFDGEAGVAARAILEHGVSDGWRYVEGELPGTLGGQADVIFWDAFSPRANPSLWNVAAFTAARRCARDGCTLHTFSGATSVRTALLLAGFFVGLGEPIGNGRFGTVAATSRALLERPFDLRFLERVQRSSAPLPPDAPAGALVQLEAILRS
jgi:queuine tRNA-ribosyltransferase